MTKIVLLALSLSGGMFFVGMTILQLRRLRNHSKKLFRAFAFVSLATLGMVVSASALNDRDLNPDVTLSLIIGIGIAGAFVSLGLRAYEAGLQQGQRENKDS